jgi:hypothetical protein
MKDGPRTLFFDRHDNRVDNCPNPNLSEQQRAFEAWAHRQANGGRQYDLSRNFYVPYHGAPYSYEELFGEITEWNYYTDPKTQGAWDGWRARDAVSL